MKIESSSYCLIDQTDSNCLVCVAMLAYNQEKYIVEALESVLSQNVDFQYKIIVADDASTDGTRNILKTYQEKYPNLFKLLLQNENVGVRQNNIDLLSNVEGEYVAALEGDDYWVDSNKLQRQVNFLKNNLEYSFCWTRFKTLHQDSRKFDLDHNIKYFKINQTEIDFDFEKLYRGWQIGTQTLVYRRRSFNIGLAGKYQLFRDIHIIVELLNKGKGACLNFIGAVYRLHDGGVYSSLSRLGRHKKSFECYKELYLSNKSNIFLKKKYIKSYKNFIQANIMEAHFLKALKFSAKLLLINYSILDFLKHIRRIYKAMG
ncbi:glycosyltransferase [Snuella sedimenti]|uniref:Glycosyltransferase family 2 protein n=1 Tax=Snuella sedimenti TaxID=2798802 RepID=A0A8J7LS08_9FLAO|nr:glycosyltransferase family 2 protein [Snuella sedimenti]MBJ6367890.1 glycosyltransferase family 2 protein [Snuella sedimenti]